MLEKVFQVVEEELSAHGLLHSLKVRKLHRGLGPESDLVQVSVQESHPPDKRLDQRECALSRLYQFPLQSCLPLEQHCLPQPACL